MRKIEIKNNNFKFSDDITCFFEKTVTSFGTGAKIDCSKNYIGRKVYVLIVKE